MTVQDITMGYDRFNGQRITLTQHEKNVIEFCEYRGIDATAWRKDDQIGYYRALQEDWETARDDDQDPPVVDHLEDLPPEVLEQVAALTEQERTGYAAQEFGQSIGQIDYRYRAHGYPFPVNGDHTTMFDQYKLD